MGFSTIANYTNRIIRGWRRLLETWPFPHFHVGAMVGKECEILTIGGDRRRSKYRVTMLVAVSAVSLIYVEAVLFHFIRQLGICVRYFADQVLQAQQSAPLAFQELDLRTFGLKLNEVLLAFLLLLLVRDLPALLTLIYPLNLIKQLNRPSIPCQRRSTCRHRSPQLMLLQRLENRTQRLHGGPLRLTQDFLYSRWVCRWTLQD